VSFPKVHLLFEFTDGAGGGGNQFLKALKRHLKGAGLYEDRPEAADVILVNSHHRLLEAIQLKKKHPEKILLHRLAGPISLTRSNGEAWDAIIRRFNHACADGTVFQSSWSRRVLRDRGLRRKSAETVIHNAPDPTIFHGKPRTERCSPVRLIATSWSMNPNKGFDIYKFMDENLDFHTYEMTFVGNSPVAFTNLNHIPAQSSEELANILREHDIFITACRDDACSNALIEALHCRLPAVVLDSGGNREILGDGGVTFAGKSDLLQAVDVVTDGLEPYSRAITVPGIAEVAQAYCEFGKTIYDAHRTGGRESTGPSSADRFLLLFGIRRIGFLSWTRGQVRRIWRMLHHH